MKWSEGGGQYERPSVGSHLARCYAVIDLGSQPHSWGGETRMSRDVRIVFELPYERMDGRYNPEMKGRAHVVSMTVRQSLHPKSTLRKLLEGWRGRRFDAESISAFDPKSLIGLPCRLSLIESESGYINIDSISPATKQEAQSLPRQENEGVFFSLERDEYSARTFASLRERMQEKIKDSPEWKALQEPEPASATQPTEDEQTSYDEIPF